MNTTPEYITPGAFVRIRDGSKARIYATDGLVPIHGAIWIGSGWVSERWFEGGVKNFYGDSPLDIVGPWVEKSHGLWSKLPPWMRFLAQDQSGVWYAYSKEPQIYQNVWDSPDGSYDWLIPDEFAPAFAGDWTESLIRRPKA